VWCARELVGNEPFALLLPDVLVQHPRGCIAQMIDAAKELDAKVNIIAVEEVPKERLDMYGVVGVGAAKGKAFAITQMVEKPKPADAPSNLTITGRYILQPEIFAILEKQAAGTGGEIQLTDAMLALAAQQPFYGLKFEGRSYDCGSKIGFLAANVAYGLDRPDLAPEFRAEIERILGGK
jgi:UTP--glucose-1-phosphate uridylyltransferase